MSWYGYWTRDETAPNVSIAIGIDGEDDGVLRIDMGWDGLTVLDVELTIAERVEFASQAARHGWTLLLGG